MDNLELAARAVPSLHHRCRKGYPKPRGGGVVACTILVILRCNPKIKILVDPSPCRAVPSFVSGKKKGPKPKLFGPDIFRWGGGLPREGVGNKKFGMSCEAPGNQTFWQDIMGFLPGYPGNARKV